MAFTNPIPFGSGAAGVEINEINNSFYPAPTNTAINGQIFILSDFGPINTPVNVSSVQQFEQIFGTMSSGVGNGNMMQYPYTTAEMLLNTVNLWVTRVGVGNSTTGTPGQNAVLNLSTISASSLVSQAQTTSYVTGILQQAYVGVGGNQVAVKNDPLTKPNSPKFSVYFNGVLVESYDYYGNAQGLATQINTQSNYITIPTTQISQFTSQLSVPLYYASNGQPVNLVGGTDDQITEQTVEYSINNSPLINEDTYILNYIFVGGYTEIYPQPSGDDGQVIISALTSLVETRKDCMLLGELPLNTSVSSIATLQSNPSSPDVTPALGQYTTSNGFTAVYYPWVYATDPISGYNIYVPPTIQVAPIFVNIDKMDKPWIQPAGYIYGGISALGLSYNPTKSDQDILQFNAINPIMNYVTTGIYVWGQFTQVLVRSALNRIHARRTTTYIEQTIKNIAKNFLFADYTQSTINKFTAEVEQFLNSVEKLGGITYYNWQTVSTPVMIDQHMLTQNLQFVPVSTIEYITLNFTIESNEVVASEQVQS